LYKNLQPVPDRTAAVPIEPSAPGRFDAAIASIEHAVSLRWLHRQLTTDFAGPTVVVSHHAPSLQSVGETPAFLKNREHWNRLGMHKELFEVLNYASDLSATLKEHSHAIQLWCHGHVHESRDYLEGGVRVVCNAQGLGANTPGVITLELKATGVPVATAPFQPTHAARREDSHAL
jgi:Icc-related predicted phosphoesterase